MCYYERKGITIPARSVERDKDDEGYLTYYIAHELAHIFAFRRHGEKQHGMPFMKEFKKICPVKYQFYELEYKPRNAKKAGIKKNRILRSVTFNLFFFFDFLIRYLFKIFTHIFK